jgi:hypothetical protein
VAVAAVGHRIHPRQTTIAPVVRTAAFRWLRLRIFSVAGRLASGGRRLRLRLAERWPWAAEIAAAVTKTEAKLIWGVITTFLTK